MKFDNKVFEIIPINIVGKEDINQRIKRIGKEKEIICIICPFNLNTNIPQYGLDEVLNLKAIKKMQEVIDVQNTYLKMGETLKHHLKNVDGMRIFEDIKSFIALIEEELKIDINIDMLIGIVFHIGCMIDRFKGQEAVVEYACKNEYIRDNHELYCCIKNSLKFLDEKYDINITDDEICYIMNFFNTNMDTTNSVLA